jgi:sodium/proline symporter
MMDLYEKLSDPVALTVFVATLLLPVFVGLLAMRRARSQSDFFVGGRAMSMLVVALSTVSSGRSSWLVLGVSGMAYTRGLGAIWAVAGYTAVELAQFLLLGPRLRRDAQEGDAITLLDWLETRHRDSGHRLRLAGALVIGVFITAYVAAQLNAGAKTLESALGIPLVAALAIAAVLILVYMVLGGFIAVAYNDVVRALIMMLGLVVLPIWGFVDAGGVGAVLEQVRETDAALLDPLSLGAGVLVGFLGIGLGSPGQPHILVRYMSIRDPRRIVTAAWVGFFWNVVLGAGACAVGIIGRAAVPAASSLPDADPEMVYLVLSAELFGPLLYGLLVGGIFAAILSTADSQLLVVASTAVRDVWEAVVRGGRAEEERRRVALSRGVLVVAGVAAMLLAWLAEELVFWLVLFAWGGLGAAFGPVVIASLFWRGTTRDGALAGMVAGTVVTIAWRLLLKDATGLYELIPGFLAGLAALVAVSLWDARRR